MAMSKTHRCATVRVSRVHMPATFETYGEVCARRGEMSYAGQPLKRLEDPRLLTGHGAFVDDIRLPDMLHACVLRSPHAHARLRAIDVEAARRLDGVVAVLSAA